ncbi:MAG TPA: hypothetical protein VFF17_14615, partial [Thermoanaerobaculia bacterium]|nr:hypothetical protein [Thermoanaerobaculia bacterium]
MPRDRPRLWESFKRALGGPSPSNEPEPDGKATHPGYAPPFLPPDEPAGGVLPGVGSSPLPPPVDRNPPAAEPPSAGRSVPMVSGSADELSGSTPAPSASEVPRSPRLARGLASFSRDNADREKKFRHILSDEGGG